MLSALQSPQTKPFSLSFSSPGHRWPSPSVADTAHGARMHGAEAWSSHQTVSPDRASKSCFLCTVRQLTALLHLFLFFLFLLFFNISTCSRVFFPLSLFFSKNTWNWKHWELICRQGEKKKTNPQQKTSNKLNYFFCTCKAHGKTAGISPREPHQPVTQWCKASTDQMVCHLLKLPMADAFPRGRVGHFQMMMVCLGQFLDMNISFSQLWHTSFILKCKWSLVAL